MKTRNWWILCGAGGTVGLVICLIVLDAQSARRRTKHTFFVPGESDIAKMTATIYGIHSTEDIQPIGPVEIPIQYFGTVIGCFENGEYNDYKGCLTDWDFALGELVVVTKAGSKTRLEWCDKDSRGVFAFAVDDLPCARKKWASSARVNEGFLLCQIIYEIHNQEENGKPSKKLGELLSIVKGAQPEAK